MLYLHGRKTQTVSPTERTFQHLSTDALHNWSWEQWCMACQKTGVRSLHREPRQRTLQESWDPWDCHFCVGRKLPFCVVQNNCHEQLRGALSGWGYPRGHMGNRQHLSQSQNRDLSWLLCPKKLQMSPSHSGLRQLSPRAWHRQSQGPSGALCADVWLETPSNRAQHMHKLHMHTLWSLLSGGVCMVHHPVTEVTPNINSWEINWREIASKDHIFHRRGWSGWGFLLEFSHQKKGRSIQLFWLRCWISLE